MSRIRIKNLGSIQHFENDADEEMMVLIGEQASGKSIIAKTIFYVKVFRKNLKNF